MSTDKSEELEDAVLWLRRLMYREELGTFDQIQRKVCTILDALEAQPGPVACEALSDDWEARESLESAITKACGEAGYHFGIGEGCPVAARAALAWFDQRAKVRPVDAAAIEREGKRKTLEMFRDVFTPLETSTERGKAFMQVVDFANATMEFISATSLAPQEAMTRALAIAEQGKQALRAEVERKDVALREWRREERAELDTAKRAVKDANRRAHDLRCATDQHKRDLVAAKAELAETKKAVQTDIRDNLARQAEAHAREMAEYRARQEEYVNGVVSECDRTKGRNALLVCRNQALEAEARDSLLREIADPGTFVDMHAAIDALEHACIAESVAPALEYIDEMVKLGHVSLSDSRKLRSLLTEGRE